ncbi:MAG: hypothetical protein ACK4UL_10955 [Novosphingobium meiothermophilum]|uniref:hypothetical protein n=1 Tax=Novosphingobium TaxID=165696 RepID=UPI0011AB3C44|nr:MULTISPECIES: hypothetical protein [Novosphingobium]
MGGFGHGFGRLARRRSSLREVAPPLPRVRPSAGWTGIAGSGFAASGFGSVPTDPQRLTAKPAMRLLVPPDQFYRGTLAIGVVAGANNGGSLLQNMGLASVIVHCEGRQEIIDAPTWHRYRDVNGERRECFGWWARLVHDGRDGEIDVYFEAVPLDPAMQRRVMGPFRFYPSRQEHDWRLTVEPGTPVVTGSRYPDVAQALAFLAGAGANNPLVTIHGGGTIDIAQGAFGPYQGKGYCTIRADEPVTIARSGFTSDAAAIMRPRYDGLRFSGRNITIDAQWISSLYHENPAGRQHWLDGIRIVNSAGRDQLWRGSSRRIGQFVRDPAWLTECTFDGLPNAACGASLVRGCLLKNGYHDVVSDAACVVHSRTDDWDSSFWTQDVPAFTVRYTGPEPTATIELAGANEAATRTFTARWGANSATFTVGTSEAMMASGNYWPGDVAAWLQGLGAGFVVAVQDNTRRAAACSLAGAKGTGFGPQNVKDATLQIVTLFDVHSDWHQQNTGRITENCVLANNLTTGIVAQDIFLTATGGARDFLIFNNAFHNKTLTGPYTGFTTISSQMAYAKSHVVIVHNTLASQALSMRGDQSYTADDFCLVAGNSLRDLSWPGSRNGTGLIRDNHLQAGASGTAIGEASFAGGTREQLFLNSAAGDFTVRGALHATRRMPVIAWDRTGRQRASADAAGSEAVQSIAIAMPAAPAPRCVQFPSFNRHYAGRAGHIAFANAGITSQPLLRHDTPGAFFIMLQIAHERTNLNREARIIGNAVGSAGGTFSLVHYGDDHFDTARHDELRWRARGSTGDTIDLSLDVQTRGGQWQLVVVTCDGNGQYGIASYARGSARIAGSGQTSGNAQINTLSGTHVLLGDVASAPGGLTPLTAPAGAFDGAVAFHGFVLGSAGSDAAWQAIAEGAPIAPSLPGATGFRLLRDYRLSADPAQTLSPITPDDLTAPGTVHGTVMAGGTSNHGQAKFLHFDRLPDGYVICPRDGEPAGTVRLVGTSSGLSGALFAQVLGQDGAILVPPFVCDGTGPVMDVMLPLPPFSGWGTIELWSESDPAVVFRMNSRIGCGHKVSVIGQSQCDIMLYAGGVTQAPSGLASFCGYIGTRSDPADTATAPVARFSTAARPQLFVIEPEMTGAFNGVTAIASRVEPFVGGQALCVIDTCVPGTSALAWIRNSVTTRQWALDVEVARMAGSDRVPVWQWYTADAGSYPALLDGVVHGTGSLAGDNRLFDGTINAPGYRLGICLPTRATTTTPGPLAADDFGTNRSGAQAGQLQWASANAAICAVGPATTDIAIDNQASGTPSGPNTNLGGPHPSQVLPEGCVRLGRRIGETYLRARGLSPSPGNAFLSKATATMSADRSVLTIKAVLPNGGGLRTDDGRAVTGFEVSTDGGATWSRSSVAAAIIAPDTLALTFSGGSWPVGARIAYLRGGPFSYGTAEELAAHYKGSLYDGCEADGGLGFPVLELPASDALVV